MFSPEELTNQVQTLLNSEVSPVPPGHKVAMFAGVTTDGAKAAVAYRPSDSHDWTINIYDDYVFKSGNEAGIAFKGSF